MKRVKIISWFGLDFLLTDIRHFPRKTEYTIERFNLKYIIVRYNCGNYYIHDVDRKPQYRIRVRKMFPNWRYLP